MKQIELRLALVLYGGVSLAVYMHGISREVLNLVRASELHRACQERPALAAKLRAAAPDAVVAYARLFEALGERVDLRVVVDTISGASAGGVNGIMLARAIAHDLPLDQHRDLWLQRADVTQLSEPSAGLSRYLKGSVSPVLDRLFRAALKTGVDDLETREKLRSFMQARWFSPPFSGERYAGWMLDACAAMDEGFADGATLIPQGQTLDLFVTLTDYFGHDRRIRIHDPAFIVEKEHRRILRFSAHHKVAGVVDSSLTPAFAPDHVFAARATSSFPGAFPPATIDEMDNVLEKRRADWPNRDSFLRDQLGVAEGAPSRRVFLDGSVVMNKPFAPVIEAIRARPATREVVRRLVYVDPNPATARASNGEGQGVPGFFRAIFASLAHIPRNEPIGEELRAIERHNRRARHLAEVIAGADPVVAHEVGTLLDERGDQPLTLGELARIRAQANEVAHRQAGYTFLSYQKLKTLAVAERLAQLVCDLAERGGARLDPHAVERIIHDRLASGEAAADHESVVPEQVIEFLRGFDIDYRIRRLSLVIRKLNGFYRSEEAMQSDLSSDEMEEVRTTLFEQINRLSELWSAASYDDALAVSAARLGETLGGDECGLAAVLEEIQEAMGLRASDRLHDEIFAVMGFAYFAPPLCRVLVSSYVGFAFYDLVTLPVLQRNDFVEINETLVDRISPSDSRSIDDAVALKGAALNSFGAFFNRSWREHDYLWGRLNAADRLLSIVLTAIAAHRPDGLDEDGLRRELFLAICDEEAAHLAADPALVPRCREAILTRLGGPAERSLRA